MPKLLNRFGVTVILSLLALTAGCAGGDRKAKDASDAKGGGSGAAEVGKPAPDLTIQTMNGKGKFSLESLQGKVVVIDFWATWCGPCKESFPKLEALAKRAGDKVEIIGISVDEPDEKKNILDFAKANGNVSFAIGWDEGHEIVKRYPIKTMPTTYIVDATGKVRYVHDGFHPDEPEKLQKELSALVDEAPSGNVKIAKNETKERKDDSSSSSPSSKDNGDKHSDKPADKPEPTTASGGGGGGDDSEEPAPPPKKKGGKGKSKAGAKSPPKKKKK